MNCFKIIFTTIILFSVSLISAQEYLFDTEEFTTKDGLSNIFTSATYQDKQGFLWVSTAYGLNRYDGYQFKLIKRGETKIDKNHLMYQITGGDNNNLWLFYNKDGPKYIEVLDTKTEKTYDFKTYYKHSLPFEINNVAELSVHDVKNRPWIVTEKGELYLFENQRFIKVFQTDDNQNISAVSIDENDNVFIGTEKQLIQTDFKGKIKSSIYFEHLVKNVWIDEGKVWIETRTRKQKNQRVTLWEKSITKDSIKEFYGFNVTKFKAPNSILIYPIDKHFLIIGNEEIFIINRQKEKVKDLSKLLYKTIFIVPFNISYNQNILWIGLGSGLVKIQQHPQKIKVVHRYTDQPSDCRGITEDELGNIYFNNIGGYKYDPKSNSINVFREKQGAFSLYYYDNIVHSGIYNLKYLSLLTDLKSKTTRHVSNVNDENAISVIETNQKGELLVGTQKGLSFFNFKSLENRSFLKYNEFNILKNTSVNTMKRQGDTTWLATNEGIFLMTDGAGILRHFSEETGDLPFDYIQHFYIDEVGVFWLATKGGGLIRWQPSLNKNKRSTFKQFTINEGLSHNYLYSVYGDDYNNLWISSDYGIMKFDKETKQIQTFTTNDGLLHNEFNFTAHYQAKNGTLYFGGLGGLIALHPKDFKTKVVNRTPLALTSFLVLENDNEAFTDKTLLVRQSKSIALRSSDKLVELRFSLLNFAKKEYQTYAYKIEGYTNNWNYSNENFIRITNLPYGTYQLKIKGKTGSESWSTNELKLTIKVLKPFYLQWWFITSVIAAVLGLIFWIGKQRIQRLETEKEKLELEVKKRTTKIETDKFIIEQQSKDLKALDVAKSKFFSNITHEFRTPLTLILGPVQQLQKEPFTKKITQIYLNNIENNAYNLLGLVNQLLDLSKLEVGKMPLELVEYDIVDFTKELINELKFLAASKVQQIHFQSNHTSWITIFDKDKWRKIVSNLLSNAIKFTPLNGQITIELNEEKQGKHSNIILTIKDNGIGITKEGQQYIFDRFHQVDNSSTRLQEGTGIGLALVKELVELQNGQVSIKSELGVGTVFRVSISTLSQKKNNTKITSLTPSVSIVSPKILNEMPSVFKNENALKLLIVEDNAEMRAHIKSCLPEHHFEIMEAENGQIGIEKAIQYVPDLIVSDVMMPYKDGFEVTKEIRQNMITSHIPIILLTAKSSLENRLVGIKRGADIYLTKPFSAEELVLRIYKLIELRKLLQQRYAKTSVAEDNTTEHLTIEIEDEFITSFKSYILNHISDENLNSDALAKIFFMSRMQLHRKMKALTDQSTAEYVRILRLETALNLLKTGKLSISQIAHQTGFSTPSHFSRSFKKHYQKSPSEI